VVLDVLVGHLVVDLGTVLERLEAVRHADRDVEHAPVVGAQLDAEPPPKGAGVRA
jgi:hypothetical protein